MFLYTVILVGFLIGWQLLWPNQRTLSRIHTFLLSQIAVFDLLIKIASRVWLRGFKMRYLIALLAACLVSALANAEVSRFADEDEEGERQLGWESSVEVGFIATTGNSESTSFIGKFDIEHDSESFRNQLKFDSLFKQDETEQQDVNSGETRSVKATTEQKYQMKGQSFYKLDDFSSLFGRLSYDDNRFSSYEYQASATVGYSNRVVDSAAATLDLSIGSGLGVDKVLSQEEVVNPLTNETEIDQDEKVEMQGILFLSALYKRQVSENTDVTLSFETEYGELNAKSVLEGYLQVQINNSLALKTGIRITNNSEVEAGFKNTDSESTVTLVYAF